MHRIRMAAFLLAGLLGGCATAPPPNIFEQAGIAPLPKLDAGQQRGRDFAVRRCAGCHTVGLDDGGAQEGPSFRKLALRYNSVSLQRRFAEVSEHGFDRMPAIPFTRSEADDLVAYLETLQAP